MARNVQVKFNLTEYEFKLLEQKRTELGLTVAGYCRMCVLHVVQNGAQQARYVQQPVQQTPEQVMDSWPNGVNPKWG